MLSLPVMGCHHCGWHSNRHHDNCHHPVPDPVSSALHQQVTPGCVLPVCCQHCVYLYPVYLTCADAFTLTGVAAPPPHLWFQPILKSLVPWWQCLVSQLESQSTSSWTQTVQTTVRISFAGRRCRARYCGRWPITMQTTGRRGDWSRSWQRSSKCLLVTPTTWDSSLIHLKEVKVFWTRSWMDCRVNRVASYRWIQSCQIIKDTSDEC